MGGVNGRRTGALSFLLIVAILLAASLAALPSCSASTTPPTKPNTLTQPATPSPPPVHVSRRNPSSVVFPVKGNVYPDGLYYVSMNIGDPPKPYFLDVDTGSDLTWLHCDAPRVRCPKCPHPLYRPAKNKLLRCNDPLCAALQSPRRRPCESDRQCDYEIIYADRSSSLGVLVTDAFTFGLTNASLVRPQLAFGCGYDQEGRDFTASSLTDGVLGLGGGKISILSQLRDQGVTRGVAGHCLGRRGSGYLFFGDDLVPSSGVTWVPMSRIATQNHYSPGSASLFLGNQSLGTQAVQIVFDSGSSYSFLQDQAYQAFLAAVKSDLSKTPLKPVSKDRTHAECWKGPSRFGSTLDVNKYFRPLVLNFLNGRDSQLEIPPENYLIISKFGNACLGILNGTKEGLNDLNVVGDVSLQDLMVIYDNESQQIGWARASCDNRPKSGTSPRL